MESINHNYEMISYSYKPSLVITMCVAGIENENKNKKNKNAADCVAPDMLLGEGIDVVAAICWEQC